MFSVWYPFDRQKHVEIPDRGRSSSSTGRWSSLKPLQQLWGTSYVLNVFTALAEPSPPHDIAIIYSRYFNHPPFRIKRGRGAEIKFTPEI